MNPLIPPTMGEAITYLAQSAGAVEYTNCFSAER